MDVVDGILVVVLHCYTPFKVAGGLLRPLCLSPASVGDNSALGVAHYGGSQLTSRFKQADNLAILVQSLSDGVSSQAFIGNTLVFHICSPFKWRAC